MTMYIFVQAREMLSSKYIAKIKHIYTSQYFLPLYYCVCICSNLFFKVFDRLFRFHNVYLNIEFIHSMIKSIRFFKDSNKLATLKTMKNFNSILIFYQVLPLQHFY